MAKPSRQRALIALRSFPSVSAAARSVGTTPSTLMRMTLNDTELLEAYEECVYGVIRQRRHEVQAAEKRAQEKPRVSERTAERRMARLFAATGRDPRIVAAALHKRLNREHRQEKAANIKATLAALDELMRGRPSSPPSQRVLDTWDRWCANCQAHRVDDPCEMCNRHTLEVK